MNGDTIGTCSKQNLFVQMNVSGQKYVIEATVWKKEGRIGIEIFLKVPKLS